MNLSDFQKKIIESIAQKGVIDIESFLSKFCSMEDTINTEGNFVNPYGKTVFKQGIKVKIPHDDDLVLTQIKEFISLWKSLENFGLIFTIPKYLDNNYVLPIFTRNCSPAAMKPNFEIAIIIEDFLNKQIVFNPEINDFISNGFLTTEEYTYEQEKLSREKSHGLTKRIAYFSIGTTIAISIITTSINLCTSSKHNKVLIENKNAFSDTLNIKVVEPKAQELNILKTNDSLATKTIQGSVIPKDSISVN